MWGCAHCCSTLAQDPPQKVGFVDDHGSCCATGTPRCRSPTAICTWRCRCATSLRGSRSCTAGSYGHGAPIGEYPAAAPHIEDFRRLQRDLYVPAGDVSFWQAALRDPRTHSMAATGCDPRAHRAQRQHPLRRPRGRATHDHPLLPHPARPPRRRGAVAVGVRHLASLEPRSRRPTLAALVGAIPRGRGWRPAQAGARPCCPPAPILRAR